MAGLDPRTLADRLRNQGVEGLWEHQLEAAEHVHEAET